MTNRGVELAVGLVSQGEADLINEFVTILRTGPLMAPGMPTHIAKAQSSEQILLLLDLVRRAAGQEVIVAAYGPTPQTRVDALKAFADRTYVAAHIWGDVDKGSGSLVEAQYEAIAVSEGDVPVAFAKTEGRKKSVRLLWTKFAACRFEAWLSGLGIDAAQRHNAIGAAYGAQWDTISRWKQDVAEIWPSSVFQLERDYIDAQRGLTPLNLMAGGEMWEAALKRAGRRYKRALKDR